MNSKNNELSICTNRLRIRRFRENDFDFLHVLLSDPEVMRFLEPPYSEQQTRDFLDRYGLCASPAVWAVEDHTGQGIGYVIYHPYESDSYEIGWVLRREDWRKGYAQELTAALIRSAQTHTDGLVLECVPEQAATRAIARRNGFVYEGKSENLDVYKLRLRDDSRPISQI